MKEHLLISGCSWSCGEWHLNSDNKLFLAKDVFTEQLSKKYKVFNISTGGNSNWESLYSISNFKFYPSVNYKILLFQTDPSRTKLSNYFGLNEEHIYEKFLNIDNIEYFFDYLVNVFYYKVEEIINKLNININIVGGLTDLMDIKSDFPKINFFCNSWQSLIFPKPKISCAPPQISSKWFELAFKHKKYNLCDQIEEHNMKNFEYYNELMSSELVGASFGDFHPNTAGFGPMVEYILNNELK